MANVIIKKNFVDGDKLFAQQLNNNFETIEKAINDGNKIVWQDGTEVKFKRYVTNDIDSLPVLDGSVIYDIEKGRHYIDYKGERVQVGSAGKEVIIQETEPTEEDNKIWIDSNVVNTMGTEIINEHSDSNILGYSANYLNGKTIVESGSNDKGSYVKFGDGTLIQKTFVSKESFIRENDYVTVQNIKFYRSDNPHILFPIPFIDTDYTESIVVNYVYNANALSSRLFNPICTDKTKDGINVQMISVQDFGGVGLMETCKGVDITVIGKWK